MSEVQDARRATLALFGEAWIRRDIDALLSLMTPDAVYAASVGPEPGRTFRGAAELRAGFEEMFAHDAGADIALDDPQLFGDQAIGGWTYTFADSEGEPRLVKGIDVWRFEGDRISLKDAYRKTTGG
jgi:ketosteroid isomerase-like protein